MSFEAEVFPLFIGGVCVVTILELVFGCILLRGQKKALGCLVGHAVSMAVAMVFLIQCIFTNRLNPGPDYYATANNSVNIGMFGIFWAVSVCFALGLARAAAKK